MGNRSELEEMGKKILNASRTELYLSMRFLGPALHSLGFIMDLSTTAVGTDAAYIRFNPNYLFRLYVDRPRLLNRTYLHILLHCLFRHMFTARAKEDRELWDLASDIAVGYILDSMEYGAVAELTPDHRQRVYEKLEQEIRVLTAERIYQYFLERKRNYMEELQLRAMFALCDHSFWERMEEEERDGADSSDDQRQDPEKGDRDNSRQDGDGRDSPGREPGRDKDPADRKPDRDQDPPDREPGRDQNPPDQKSGRDMDPSGSRKRRPSGGKDDPSGSGNKPSRGRGGRPVRRLQKLRDLEGNWKETSKRMEAELLATGKEASRESGSLERILSISNRRRTDYREFLRKFAVLREVVTIDPDSFDYGFYHYGLEVYGNMPLIEENEYRELNRIRTLVIAIDTSASCQAVLVQRFINETAAVLRSIGSFFHTSEVYIIECDEHVQQVRVLHDPDELEQYAGSFKVRGGFGTDFRPVFSYVEEKRRTGEIREIEGLMFFTDGMGIYPERPVDYDTAFVFFNDEELDDTKVPDWAVRLYIDGEKVSIRHNPLPAGDEDR